MIKTFRHKGLQSGLQSFFETGSKAGIQPHHASKLARQLARLDIAKTADDMNVPGWRLHPLVGDLAGHFSIFVNGNWRVTFKFEGDDVVLADYQDYH
jgi:proteic killer suppression protein